MNRLGRMLPALMVAGLAGVKVPADEERGDVACIPMHCGQCGLAGTAFITRGPLATPRGLEPRSVTQWVEPPRGWAISVVQGGPDPTVGFRCRRCTFGQPNYGREQFLDHAGTFGEVKREGRLERAGVKATTCLECDEVIARGEYATDRELDAHRATCVPKGASGAGSVEP